MFIFWSNFINKGYYSKQSICDFGQQLIWSSYVMHLCGWIRWFLIVFLIILQFHISTLQVSIPSLAAPMGLETSEKSKLPSKLEASFQEKYVSYGLAWWEGITSEILRTLDLLCEVLGGPADGRHGPWSSTRMARRSLERVTVISSLRDFGQHFPKLIFPGPNQMWDLKSEIVSFAQTLIFVTSVPLEWITIFHSQS